MCGKHKQASGHSLLTTGTLRSSPMSKPLHSDVTRSCKQQARRHQYSIEKRGSSQ